MNVTGEETIKLFSQTLLIQIAQLRIHFKGMLQHCGGHNIKNMREEKTADRIQTHDLLFSSFVLYHLATATDKGSKIKVKLSSIDNFNFKWIQGVRVAASSAVIEHRAPGLPTPYSWPLQYSLSQSIVSQAHGLAVLQFANLSKFALGVIQTYNCLSSLLKI